MTNKPDNRKHDSGRQMRELKKALRQRTLDELRGEGIRFTKGQDEGCVVIQTQKGQAVFGLLWRTWKVSETVRGQGLWSLKLIL